MDNTSSNLDAKFFRASQLHMSGNLHEARDIFREILKMQPDHVNALHFLGILEKDLKNFQIAMQLIARAIKLKPGDAYSYNSMGRVLKDIGKFSDALSFFQRAIELKPGIADFYFNLASIFHLQEKFTDAEKNYYKSIELFPGNFQVYVNLGILYSTCKNLKQAEINFKKANEFKPDSPELYNLLALVQQNSGKLYDAEINFKKVLEINPSFFPVYTSLGILYNNLGKFTDAEKNLQKVIEINPDFIQAYSDLLLFLQYQDNLTQEVWKKALDLFNSSPPVIESRFSVLPHKYDNEPVINRKLRLGYVSADFRDHSCCCFVEPLFENHERSSFEITCYAEVQKPDEQTAKIKKLADRFHLTSGISDAEMVRLIEKDKIDILIDLTGHTTNNRLIVFAAKPAQLQVTWLGFPGSTGLKEIDYRISDKWLTPDDSSEYFTETLWNLKSLSHCYKPPPDSPGTADLPFFKNGYITFCSFNNLNKITENTVQIWCAVLNNITDSRLILKTNYITGQDIKQYFIDLFEKYGVKPERIDFFDTIDSIYEHLDFYNRVDIALDTYPYNGATTTLEALWMGVPVISLTGSRTASRYGLSFLTAVGLPELAVNSMDDFVKTAFELSSDTMYLSTLRNEMRQKMINSPVMDYIGFSRSLEDAYREMWKNR